MLSSASKQIKVRALAWRYYIVMSKQSEMRPEVKLFHDWLVEDVKHNGKISHPF